MTTTVGDVTVRRRWWASRCVCQPGGFHADAVLGVDGAWSRRLERQVTRLAADVSFAKTQGHLAALLGVTVAVDSVRTHVEAQAARLAAWQPTDTATPAAFAQADGQVELALDAGKACTIEYGWRDLKIAVVSKRPAGPPATPAQWATRELPGPTAQVAWARVAPVQRFRPTWRPWLRRLGVTAGAEVQVLADGASWIWKAAQRVVSGCRQTLDIYHACQHLAQAGQRLYGEGTAEATAFLERSRTRLLADGWRGVCDTVADELTRGDTPLRRHAVERLVKYFAPHLHRLDYRTHLAAGEAIGSGVVEGWAKTLGLRLKARGARWRLNNVQAMAALGCVANSDQWEAYWAVAA